MKVLPLIAIKVKIEVDYVWLSVLNLSDVVWNLGVTCSSPFEKSSFCKNSETICVGKWHWITKCHYSADVKSSSTQNRKVISIRWPFARNYREAWHGAFTDDRSISLLIDTVVLICRSSCITGSLKAILWSLVSSRD